MWHIINFIIGEVGEVGVGVSVCLLIHFPGVFEGEQSRGAMGIWAVTQVGGCGATGQHPECESNRPTVKKSALLAPKILLNMY